MNRQNLFQNKLSLLGAINYPNDFTQVRYIRKHWDPKWKKLRRAKVIKIRLPSFDEKKDQKKDNEMSKEQMRSRMREHGFIPQKPWQEKPSFISSTPTIFESYVAPEGDGKYSAITKEVFSLFCFLV